MHAAVPFTVFWPDLLYNLSSTTTTTFYLRIKMQTWDENFINKVVHSESKNVFSVNFYDGHVPMFPRKFGFLDYYRSGLPYLGQPGIYFPGLLVCED
jgi:hypothetical protein